MYIGQRMASINVEKLYNSRNEDLELTLLNHEAGMKKVVNNPELHRPGLALTGFFDRFANKRIQILRLMSIGEFVEI